MEGKRGEQSLEKFSEENKDKTCSKVTCTYLQAKKECREVKKLKVERKNLKEGSLGLQLVGTDVLMRALPPAPSTHCLTKKKEKRKGGREKGGVRALVWDARGDLSYSSSLRGRRHSTVLWKRSEGTES